MALNMNPCALLKGAPLAGCDTGTSRGGGGASVVREWLSVRFEALRGNERIYKDADAQ